MPKAVSILFGALFTVAIAYAMGRVFLQRLRVKLTREEELIFGFVAGAPLLSLVLFCLASLHLIYDGVLFAMGLCVLGYAWNQKAFKFSGERLPALPRLWQWTFWPVYTIFAIVCAIYAMAPEWSPDGSSYHLGVLAHYYRAHGFVKLQSNMYANLSQGVEMLYLNAWAYGRHSAAALVHCAFLLTLPLLILRYGQRMAMPAAGAAAALFTFLSPVVMVDGASAYIDVAVVCVLFAVFYLCEIEAPPLFIGLLAGYCYAMKYTAFLAVVFVVIRFALRRRWRDIAIFAVPAAVMILPWVARNWIWFGNPFSPLFNAWFPNPWVHISFEQDYQRMMRNYTGLTSYLQLPMELAVRGQILGGFLGPLFLLTPLALLSLRKPAARRALAAAALFALPYAANVGTRFLIPALPFVAFALAAGLPSIVLPVLVLAHALLSFPDVPARYTDTYAWRISSIPFRQALRIQSEDSWLSYNWPPYRVARMIEAKTKPGDVVFSFSSIPESYTTREIRASFQSAPNEELRDYLLVALISDFQPNELSAFHFPRQSLTAVRAVQTASPKPSSDDSRDMWSIAEFRVLDQGRELPRADEWRLTARPNPWGVQKAFDNWPVTRWRSWQWNQPGMFVEIDFGKPTMLDAVHLEGSTDQYSVRLKIQGRDEAGVWKDLAAEPKKSGLPPALGLRRAAIEEFKRAGVTHLLITQDDFLWDDYGRNASLWGIREVGVSDITHLYKLE
ncbi:MAG TPA: discoidin domain-containing protein [Paludibaculum sp.]|jgi:hypothetical protein